MLLSNNTDIPTESINQELEKVHARRRRFFPLFPGSSIPAMLNDTPEKKFAKPLSSSMNIHGFRGFIKSIPLIGSLAVNLNRKKKAIFAQGLHWKVRIRLLPFIGGLAAWLYAIINLNKIRVDNEKKMSELQRIQEVSKNNIKDFQVFIEGSNTRLENIEALDIEKKMGAFVSDAQRNTEKLRESFEDLLGATQYATDNFKEKLDRVFEVIATNNIEYNQRIASLARQWRVLEISQRAGVDIVADNNVSYLKNSNPIELARMASFYMDFEDAFRGTRGDISERLKVYLPYFKNLNKKNGLSVLDIGCGRGEWLGVLAEYGINVTGIDLNISMVDTCKQYGFNVICDDAIAYLQQQPEGSLVAITGFHIIEHLTFEKLLALFDAALHALHPDGFVIFETPNPENISVGACNFYYDPTHQHPIVPAVAEFIARQRGFASTEILRLHPYPDSHRLNEDSETAKRINTLFYGPQDYAILAWKTNAN
ncbi:MAG: class I SAM-dependent methyltransferase [Betaproteobacteria bacterium]|nr:class I SAM-dependent methyltransferase [Betaproteobacteria bacterium]